MSRQGRRDTGPEVALRRALHAQGRRFRVVYPVPGQRRRTIDIAFTRRKVAVFVDGCFWHGCPEHGVHPRSNSAWWRDKLAANQARDRDTDRLLDEQGWTVLRVWEHERIEVAMARVFYSLETATIMSGPPESDSGVAIYGDPVPSWTRQPNEGDYYNR